MIVGCIYMNLNPYYNIHAPDGECHWTPDSNNVVYCCEECKTKKSRQMYNPDFYIKKKRDVVYTYDGFLIGSSRFVDVLSQIDKHGFTAQTTPSHAKYKHPYFVIEFLKIVRVNRSSQFLELGPICKTCGAYKYVLGSDIDVLDPIDPNSFYGTDLEFADGWEKGPLRFVGSVAAEILKSAKLDGLTLTKHLGT
jgi:hypothetical protein